MKPRALSCAACGLIFFTKPAQPIPDVAKQQPETKASRHPFGILFLLAAVVFLVIHYLPEIRWYFADVSKESRTVPAEATQFTEFDLAIDLKARPAGITWSEKEFVIGNLETGTFLRVVKSGNQFTVRHQPAGKVVPFTWNGEKLIGFSETGMFEAWKKYYYTIHEGATFNVRARISAPESLGGVAWDGSGYWAATRKQNENERGFLYRLDTKLKQVNKLVAPSPTCGGLAWDGSQLWFLDDAAKKLYVLNVSGIQAKILDTFDLPLRSAGGVAFDGESIWIADRNAGRLFRLSSDLSARWITPEAPAFLALARAPAASNYAEYSMPKPSTSVDLYISSFSAQVLGNEVYVSWNMQFAPRFLDTSNVERRPTFGKITVTADSENLASPITRVFDLKEDRSFSDFVKMFSDAGHGEYRIRALVYLEYRDNVGKTRVLTRAVPPITISN